MLNEDLTKTLKSADRVKVARVIADMLGVENAESMSPDTAVNQGLRKIKNKRMTPEFISTVKKMVQLAQEVGIKVDQSVIPAAVSESTSEKTVRVKDGDNVSYQIPASMEKEFIAMWKKQYSTRYGSEPFYQYQRAFREKFAKYRVSHIGEEVVSEDTVNKDSTYNAAKDILRFNDFAKLSKINKGVVPATTKTNIGNTAGTVFGEEDNAANDDETAPEEDEKDTVENIPTQVGHSMTHPADDQLRRRKVQYKLGEWVELDEAKISPEQAARLAAGREKVFPTIDRKTMDKADELAARLHREKQERDRKAQQNEEVELEESFGKGQVTIHKPGHPLHGKKADVFHRFDDGRVNAQVRHSNKKGDVSNFTLSKDQYKEVAKEEVELEEDVHSADYKISPDTGRKYRARHIEFANSKMGSSPARPEEEDSEKSKPKKHEPMIKTLPEEFDNEHEDLELSDAELDKMANEVDTEDEILDAYDEDELVIVDQDTGEIVDQVKEEVEQINEVLSRMERMRAKIRFARTASKRERRLQIALKSRSSTSKINKRARTLAVKLMKQRLIKKPLAQMTTSEKERAEKIIARRKAVINRLAMKLAPRIRKIENARLSHSKVTK